MTAVAGELANLLGSRQLRIVFAESCTAGLVSARLATVPGVSEWHCGCAVTYREATKIAWLGVDQQTLAERSAVSEEVTRQMAIGVLQKTAEADVAVAVTGHFGPHAPESLDGVVYASFVRRDELQSTARSVKKHLDSVAREDRQSETAEWVLREACRFLEAFGPR